MKSGTHVRRRAVIAALWPVAALVLSACGGGQLGRSLAASSPPRQSSAAATTVAPSSPAASPSPTPPSPSPTRPSPPRPKDGTNLRACVDGVCEVQVRVGDVIRFSPRIRTRATVGSITVLSVAEGGATLELDSGTTTTFDGGVVLNDAISIDLVFTDGKRAVLRIGLVH